MDPFKLLAYISLPFILTFLWAAWQGGAPWVPIRKKDLERFHKLAQIKPGQKIYDLGCGDGRIVFESAKKGADATGFEISLVPYIIAKLKWIFSKKKSKTKILFKNFWKADLSDADCVFIFLIPDIHKKIKSKLEQELKKGTKVIVYAWPIPEWKPKAVSKKEKAATIFLYVR